MRFKGILLAKYLVFENYLVKKILSQTYLVIYSSLFLKLNFIDIKLKIELNFAKVKLYEIQWYVAN